MGILDFLFGKDNNVFNKKGKVQHDLGQSKWSQWVNRFSADPNYDFKNHQGRKKKTASKAKN